MGDETDIDNIVRRAVAAVGSNPQEEIRIPPLADQIRALAPEAGPLARILQNPQIAGTLARQKAFDRKAVEARRSYDCTWLAILLLVFVTALIRLDALLAPDTLIGMLGTSKRQAEWLVTLLIYLSLVLTLFLAWRLGARRHYDVWNEARGAAEYLRRQVFEIVMKAPESSRAGELPVLPLKLEYFRRYQLDIQETYHTLRARQYEGVARWARRLIVPFAAVVAIWVLFLVAELLSSLGEQGPLPAALPVLAYRASAGLQHFSSYYGDIGWLLAGVLMALIYGLAFLVTTLLSSVRNAARFAHARDNMVYLRASGLEKARQSAAAGDEIAVRDFVHRVHSSMSAELNDWVRLQELESSELVEPGPPMGRGVSA